ncbi:hypothetical protein [Legionella sainthelensi]|nr:hypothetical protein [Legionella sainthelensi]
MTHFMQAMLLPGNELSRARKWQLSKLTDIPRLLDTQGMYLY